MTCDRHAESFSLCSSFLCGQAMQGGQKWKILPTSAVLPARSVTRRGEIFEIPFRLQPEAVWHPVRRPAVVLRTRISLCPAMRNLRFTEYSGDV